MSNSKERKEKNCLNCNAVVKDRYCSICGQENLETQESAWSLAAHFFNDITHFDGKFFTSVKYIVTKPGFLTSEYSRGRRMTYLNPVRFYVFTSFLFFLIMFSFFLNKNPEIKKNSAADYAEQNDYLLPANILKNATSDSLKTDSVYKKNKLDFLNNQYTFKNPKKQFSILKLFEYRDRTEFDSLDKSGKINHGKVARIIIEKQFQLQEKYKDDPEREKESLREIIFHLIPQVLFLSLPFFALTLKLLYVRRKKIYYVSHLIFTIHLYIFVYLQILFISVLNKLANYKHFNFLNIVNLILGLSIFFYVYCAMRNFYGQSVGKTIFKLFILFISIFFLGIFFLIILFGVTIFKM